MSFKILNKEKKRTLWPFFLFKTQEKVWKVSFFEKKWLGKKKKVSSNLQMIIKFCYCSLFSFDVVGGLNSLLYRALCKLIKLIYYSWLSTACFNSSFWCGWVSRRFEKVWQDEKEFETKILFALLVRRTTEDSLRNWLRIMTYLMWSSPAASQTSSKVSPVLPVTGPACATSNFGGAEMGKI